ncbi:MAG: hypothetical protein HS113_20170 [Verrucomicrobiales bacterium]|nr:hypothetical protein [Verrucomicrobiales bacterium]
MKTVMARVSRRGAIGVVAALALASTLAADAAPKKTYVSGVEENYTHVPGQWFGDDANLLVFRRACDADERISDPRLEGRGSWVYTVDATAGRFWGWGRIVPEQGGGEWSGYFTATMSAKTILHMTLTGSGDYAGLVARLTFTDGREPNTLAIEGYIVEAKRGPGERPLQLSLCRTERLELLDCVELDPSLWPPEPFIPLRRATIVRTTIVSEMGQATHAGRLTNEGFALMDPVTGVLTGTGTAKAANGDEIYWVHVATFEPNGVAQNVVHFCGGTGRFEAVTGWFEGHITQGPEPTEDPGVMCSCYTGEGAITY